MEEQKKAETKNQHYVPQFYQKYFSDDRKNIGIIVVNNSKIIARGPIKNQSSADYFYGTNMNIEHALGRLEELADVVLRKITDDPKRKLTLEEYQTIYVFTMLQFGRTKTMAIMNKNRMESLTRLMMKSIRDIKKENGNSEDANILTDEIIDHIELKIDAPGMQGVGVICQMIDICYDLKMKVIINQTDIPFVTSDNPACIYSQFMEKIGKQIYALGSRGLEMFLPITPNLALFYYDSVCYKVGNASKDYVVVENQKDICELNKLIASYADKNIYFKPGTESQIHPMKLCEYNNHYSTDKKTDTFDFETSRKTKIIGSAIKSTYCNLKLSFVKETPYSKSKNKDNYNPSIDKIRESVLIKNKLSSNSEQNE